jgi:protoheme IX farnesyltransferase
VLIIFVWTPPHFWALAMYRRDDYAKSGLPMLPITHGMPLAQFHILLYTVILVATTLLPYAVHMSGTIYLLSALFLGGMFVKYTYQLYREYSDNLARKTFRYSIVYLSLLFTALLVDHYIHV